MHPEDDGLPPTPGFKHFYADRSLGYFELTNPFRRVCIHISEAPVGIRRTRYPHFISLRRDSRPWTR